MKRDLERKKWKGEDGEVKRGGREREKGGDRKANQLLSGQGHGRGKRTVPKMLTFMFKIITIPLL